jgi:ABC-type polysaccharide/polyol phosphate export permease
MPDEYRTSPVRQPTPRNLSHGIASDDVERQVRGRSAPPELVAEPKGGAGAFSRLRELWAFRGTTLAFAERDLRVKYKQTALGVGWSVLQPLALMGIFSLAFGHLAGLKGGGVPYAAFALSALVPWTFIQTGVSFSAESLITHSALIRKVYFPREAVVLGAVGAAVVDLAIGLVMFVVVAPILGARVSVTWLLAPLIAIPLVGVAAGFGLLLAGLTAYYRDFRYALPFILQLWLFASPVVYPLSSVPNGFRWVDLCVNPAAGLLDSMRRVLTLGSLPHVPELALGIAGTLVAMALGYAVFKRLEPSLADVV